MTEQQRLHHLLDRGRRGVLLPAEGEQLAGLVAELEKSAAINAEVDARADKQLNDCTEVAQHYKALAERTQAWGEQHRDRANRYRARTVAVVTELVAMGEDMRDGEDDGMRSAITRIRAALQSISHDTPVPDDPRVTALEAELARLTAGQCTHYKGTHDQWHTSPVTGCVWCTKQPALPGDKRTCCEARIGHYPTCPANQPTA